MTDNPFEALGAGGFDMNALLQQAQQMQQQLEDAQQRLHDSTVEGTTSGGLVTVTLNGVGELTRVDVQPGAIGGTDAPDADDLEALGDLIVAAYRDAKGKADALAGDALGPLAGGLGGGLGGLGGAPGSDTTPGSLGFGGGSASPGS